MKNAAVNVPADKAAASITREIPDSDNGGNAQTKKVAVTADEADRFRPSIADRFKSQSCIDLRFAETPPSVTLY